MMRVAPTATLTTANLRLAEVSDATLYDCRIALAKARACLKRR